VQRLAAAPHGVSAYVSQRYTDESFNGLNDCCHHSWRTASALFCSLSDRRRFLDRHLRINRDQNSGDQWDERLDGRNVDGHSDGSASFEESQSSHCRLVLSNSD
jgi:hypothetical protein